MIVVVVVYGSGLYSVISHRVLSISNAASSCNSSINTLGQVSMCVYPVILLLSL